MLNFDKETIKVVKADSTGAIRVSGILTIVGLQMSFLKRTLILLLSFFLLSKRICRQSNTKEKDIVEKAKEINQKVKLNNN